MSKKRDWLSGYKVYDTSNGFGNPKQWQAAFEKRFNLKTLTEEDKKCNKNKLQDLYDARDAKSLQKIYHSLMMIYHPDIAGDSNENKTMAQLINDTYFELKLKF